MIVCRIRFQVHSIKFLGRRQINSEVRNWKLQFFCFRPTFGPIWTNFTCFRKKIVKIGPKVGLKQENYIRKNFFWVYWHILHCYLEADSGYRQCQEPHFGSIMPYLQCVVSFFLNLAQFNSFLSLIIFEQQIISIVTVAVRN